MIIKIIRKFDLKKMSFDFICEKDNRFNDYDVPVLDLFYEMRYLTNKAKKYEFDEIYFVMAD